jgi:hypothetical protein
MSRNSLLRPSPLQGRPPCPSPPVRGDRVRRDDCHAEKLVAFSCKKRVFGIEIDICARCAGKLKIIASIEDPRAIA